MTDHAPLLEKAFSLNIPEASYSIKKITGELPRFVRGSYYLNGPALFGRGDLRYRHWLDGDGMVCSLRFGDGDVQFTNRFVRTTKFAAEEEAGRSLYRTFGTAFEGDELRHGIALESPSNVSAYTFNGKLLAFGEQGLPWELDPATLETRGEYTFEGRINGITPFSAHPRIDLDTGELFNFGVSFASSSPHIHIFRFGPQGEKIYRKRVAIDVPASMHDFNLSPSYVIIYLTPYLLDMDVLMKENRTIMDALRWTPERGSRLIILSRETGEELARMEVGSNYCLHHINSFERGDQLVIDMIDLDRPVYDQYQVIPDLFTDVPNGRPVRLLVDRKGWKIVERQEIAYDTAPDFPSVDPREKLHAYDDFWLLGISKTGEPGRKFFDQLAHLSWESPQASDVYQAPPHHYLGGEPAFLPDPEQAGQGVVICQSFDAEHGVSKFLLFDPRAVSAGPVCVLELEQPIPLLFHSSFEPETS